MSDPIPELSSQGASSKVAVAGHPIHAMLVAFPIALVMATLACDALYWWDGDPFWVRAGLWASGAAFLLGLLAGLSGTAELLLVRDIRRHSAGWTHFVAAVMLLSVAGANWGVRLQQGEAALLPWGAFLSLLAAFFVGLAGWHGGKLVFEHQIGLMLSNDED
ncbi:DUF2231 domain-containing protein [Pseudoroseomonas cervicalis]|uniref:DUF2231 domain-containing protein n=1 Tax=Teichococcus cervicalis TaxID=204525 RepID=UPI0027821278|nr:DUF2231 domain-containing protein [Pseudoroseomonas cervicalis]MDQ1080680.1 putative membrane protein [Pseudoroseomonas cervicalis]